ncbi:uncharacterized protein LAJ45_08494 [Morchella importuna]|uniref:uncharacterized protein n=1 Tax=Morchella importuna TaxID=1174673 RepID=UPI001E8D2D99|nr:uncharacterized protein LAJ45_08494 [Morchella importuna]KAH8147338.1 hypothetical protein LAJ45_08494 [Morchella importuna]
MRFSILISFLLVALATTVFASWSAEDQEIFRVRDELELAEGEGTTFYEFIGLGKNHGASQEEIGRAYKKQSIRLHPDKQKHLPPPGQKKLTKAQLAESKKRAEERFARLAIIADVLRGEGRARYDHFLKNGFPLWRGTGYYYARYRPGLTSVLIGLFVFCGGGLHYCILWLNARQQRAFMERYIKHARTAAWGEAGIPGIADIQAAEDSGSSGEAAPQQPMNRAQRRTNKVAKGSSGTSTPVPGPKGAGKRKVVAENGKILIVDSAGNVFLEAKDEDGNNAHYPLDTNDIEGPKVRNTFLIRLPMWFFNITIGRFLPAKKVVDEEYEEEYEEEEELVEEETAAAGELKVVKPKKKGVPKKVESRGDGMPRRKVVARPAKKQK